MQTERQTFPKRSSARHRFQSSSRVTLGVFAAGVALIALLLFAYYAWIWRNPAVFRLAIDSCSESFCDFANYYYPMGEAILRIGLPIEGFVYSPFIAILLALFPPLVSMRLSSCGVVCRPLSSFSISFASGGSFPPV